MVPFLLSVQVSSMFNHNLNLHSDLLDLSSGCLMPSDDFLNPCSSY